jgi:hypothetical protein
MEGFLFPGGALVVGLWLHWYYSLLKMVSFRPDKMPRALIGATPTAGMLVLLAVLLRWSSPEVRSDRQAILFYLVWGALWFRLTITLLALTGVSVRDDVLERQNRAAAWVACGGMFGVSFSFAGANIGRGPGPEVVLFCAALAKIGFFVCWVCFERLLHLTERITIERDEETGVRVGGWCAAMGLVFGGAVEGDWKSAQATVRDFGCFASGAIPVFVAGILIEWFWKRQSGRSSRQISWAIAAGYFAAAGGYVWLTAR